MTLQRFVDPKFAFCLAIWAGVLGVRPGRAMAMPSESARSFQSDSMREAQIETIMSVLSRPEAQIHLRAHGVDPAKLRTKLARLDDSQLTSVAEKAEAVRSAGFLGLLIGLLVVLILVVVLILLLDDKDIDVDVKDKRN